MKDFLHQTLVGYVADSNENMFGPLTIEHLPTPMPENKLHEQQYIGLVRDMCVLFFFLSFLHEPSLLCVHYP